MRVAYLGPPGTFSDEAVGRCDLVAGAERRQYPSIPEVFDGMARGEADVAVVPIENSLEGGVAATLDLLFQRAGLKIRREILLPIRQCLLARPGLTLEGVKRVLSIPIALAQCQNFLHGKLPRVPHEHTPSTAEAARRAADLPDAAAVASGAAARHYGLAVLAEGIQDADDNVTRFVVLAREDEKPTGRDRTSIAFTLDRDRPGGVHEVLGEFAVRQINLSRIESRPSKRVLGEYVFFLDFEGHRADKPCAEALAGVLQRVHALHLLGSYPRG
jgi:prephenate dehydratase